MFKRNQTVRIANFPLNGATDWSTTGKIVRPDAELPDRYIVQFSTGGKLCIHASRLTPTNA